MAEQASHGTYNVSIAQLQGLVELKSDEGVRKLQTEYGGVEGLARRLGSDARAGLRSTDDLEGRQLFYGTNFIPPRKSASILELMWDALHDLTLIVLICSGTASLVLGVTPLEKHPEVGWIEGVSILIAVLVVITVAAVNDYQKEQQFRRLNAVKEDIMIKVIRDGRPTEVSTFDLCVGDVIRLEVGDVLTVDGVFIEGNDLKLDESSMTGESDLIKKDGDRPFLFSGTSVMEGIGKMLVVAVGPHSQAGIIMTLITGVKVEPTPEQEINAQVKAPVNPHHRGSAVDEHGIILEEIKGDNPPGSLSARSSIEDIVEDRKHQARLERRRSSLAAKTEKKEEEQEEDKSVLQGKLDHLAVQIGKLGTAIALLTVVIMALRFSIETFGIDGESWQSSYAKRYLNMFITGITVLVVAIPEGLPLAVTLSLAFSVKKMQTDNNLVRHLDACETMGSATTICSDKTGTLTTNRMTVMKSWIDGTVFDRPISPTHMSKAALEAICVGIAINSTAEVVVTGRGEPEQKGNKTECALLQLSSELGYEYSGIRASYHREKVYTFSSARKRMSAVAQMPNGTFRLFIKGASEMVLTLCTHVMTSDGERRPLEEAEKSQLLDKIIESFASDGLRTLTLAYRDYSATTNWSALDADLAETDLTLVTIVGIEDPVRPEVPRAIELCQHAGIVVRMVTGDNVTTARSIARKCGILSDENMLVMEGPEFRALVLRKDGSIDQEKFDEIYPRLRVLARSSPKDKYTLVSGAINSTVSVNREVVAVTGDGTNDGPALKRADVGFAMGIAGTSVAKDASDIILLDDNFNSIVKAVKWGRNVYDSIAKFLQFQLTVNVCAITVAFIGAVILEESPLTAVQLLWVNLIMDSFASLALATEPPTDSLLERKPYGRNKPLISRRMLLMIIGQSFYQLIVIFVLVFAGDKIFNVPSGRYNDLADPDDESPSQHYTIVFNAFVQMQMFNEINARKIHGELNVVKGMFDNPVFCFIFFGQFIAQAIIVEFGGRPFMCAPLTWEQWLACVVIGAISLPWGFALRLIPRARLPKWLTIGRAPSKPHLSRGQILWYRGLARLRAQLLAVNAFKAAMATRHRRLTYVMSPSGPGTYLSGHRPSSARASAV
eukprot:Opistho-2@11125